MTTATKIRPATELDVRRFTVAEYLALAGAGILKKEDRVELIDGVIVCMAPIGDPHAGTVDTYTMLLGTGLTQRAIIRVQGPLELDASSRLEPDLMLLRLRDDYYRTSPPKPHDVLLLIEVADSSLDYDRNDKLARYARAGIPEVWLTVLPEGVVEAHTEPTANGYRVTRRMRAGDVLRPGCFEDIEIPVDAIIPANVP